MRVVAKGYRQPKHSCAGAFEPFRLIEVIYYDRPNRDLQTASQAECLHVFSGVEAHIDRYCFGLAALELCDRVLVESEDAPQLFAELGDMFAVLERVSGGRAALVFRAFQARAAAMVGFLPELEVCAVCDGDMPAERLFSPIAGGFVHPTCVRDSGDAEVLSPEAAGLFRFMLKAHPREVADAWGPLVRPPALEVARALERFLGAHLERYRGLTAMKTLGNIRRTREKLGAS